MIIVDNGFVSFLFETHEPAFDGASFGVDTIILFILFVILFDFCSHLLQLETQPSILDLVACCCCVLGTSGGGREFFSIDRASSPVVAPATNSNSFD
ncbi:hypothetical protein BLOT_003056 [Blomia tropicalis]|nr:hypothetical protein BLOT_003056 [Blomia tropicalis]